MDDAFSQFEHDGWERVANKYDSVWASSTRQFIPPLLDAVDVSEGMSVLDVGSGPGYVSAAAAERGAKPTGVDFSKEMIAIAKKKFPQVKFKEGDAQNLPFADSTFDRVLANFALLHLADPERAFAEAQRVLKPGGKFGFTTWARKAENPFVKLVDDAIQAHANLDVDLPPGPPYYLFEDEEGFQRALERAGFDSGSMTFKLHTIEWNVPSSRFVFDAERSAGVRTAGLLARQTPEALNTIQSAIENSVRAYAKDSGFAIPKAAYIVVVSKTERVKR
jgi:SAM-dependent methyltransferase